MTKTNFLENATQMITEIHETNKMWVENLNISYTKTFPATITRTIEIDGELYDLTINLKIKKI